MKRTAIIMALAALLQNCSHPTQYAGGSSDSGNPRIVATIFNSDGTPAAGAAVRLRESDFTAPPSEPAAPASFKTDTQADSTGHFSIDSLEPGRYSIEINDGKSNGLLIRCEYVDSAIFLPADTLRPTGAIRGKLPADTGDAVVQIYGLDRVAAVLAGSDSFVIADIPRGAYRLRTVYLSSGDSATASVSVFSNDTAVVSFSSQRSARLFLNTTASGAGVMRDVHDFPLLVRLTPENFSANLGFTDAALDGSDVRFFKADGAPLPFEIERWDAGAGRAEIWVRIDTVLGNDSTQHITMTWGGPTASPVSNGAAVFDTSDGFQGVWHLEGHAKGSAAAKDATANRFDGECYNTTPESGIIGLAQRFDGASSHIRMTGTSDGALNFDENGHYTLSAWVYAERMDSVPHLIAGKGQRQYYLRLRTVQYTDSLRFESGHYLDAKGWNDVNGHASTRAWRHVAGVRDGERQYLYVDGLLVDEEIFEVPRSHARDTGNDFTIGAFLFSDDKLPGGRHFFDGLIDEVRVSNVALSDAFIRLSYMNQKRGDALVRFLDL